MAVDFAELISRLALIDEDFEMKVTWNAQAGVFQMDCFDAKHPSLSGNRQVCVFSTSAHAAIDQFARLLDMDNLPAGRDLNFGPLERHAIRANIRARERWNQLIRCWEAVRHVE